MLCAVCLVSCSNTPESEEISSYEEVSITEKTTVIQTTQTTSAITQTTTTEVDVQIVTYPKNIDYIPENAVYKRSHYVYIQGKRTLRSVTFYDENDNEVRSVSFNLDTIDYTNTYDNNGNLIKCQQIRQTDDEYYIFCDEYEYDENNRLKCANHYNESINLRYWETYEYNENGNLIQKDSWYDSNKSKPKTSDIFEYDENGNVKREKRQYNDNTESYMYVDYEYDENNRPITEIIKEKDGTLYNTITRTYDNNGNILTEYAENGEWYNTEIRVYDDKNRCISKKGMKKDGTIVVDVEYEYEEL